MACWVGFGLTSLRCRRFEGGVGGACIERDFVVCCSRGKSLHGLLQAFALISFECRLVFAANTCSNVKPTGLHFVSPHSMCLDAQSPFATIAVTIDRITPRRYLRLRRTYVSVFHTLQSPLYRLKICPILCLHLVTVNPS